MASSIQPCMFLLSMFFVFFTFAIDFSVAQSNLPRNMETFYPSGSPGIPVPETSNKPSSSSSTKSVVTAILVTAACTMVIFGLLLFLFQKGSAARKRKRGKAKPNPYSGRFVAPKTKIEGDVKGFIVDENGLDVVYWRKLEGDKFKDSYRKEVLQNPKIEIDDEEEGEGNRKSNPIHESPLLQGRSSDSEIYNSFEFQILPTPPPLTPPTPPPPAPPAPPSPPLVSTAAIAKKESSAPPPPPQNPVPKNTTPPPPPPPKAGSSGVPPKPPPPRPGKKVTDDSKAIGTSSENSGNNQVKLKPLHWDKLQTSPQHSMVWHKMESGSFSFDGDLMEALFGTVASNKKSPPATPNQSNSIPSGQIFILDSRKSQNIAIILRSLTISRREILDSLTDGHGLNTDTLEKLTRIAPTKEEESQIIAFNGDSTRLADAESFLFHLLKAVPFAFERLEAMFFRSNYVFEIKHLKEIIETLDSACKELRTRGLFLKLLEAVLKSGNRMNAGTARGNAKAFNLTALRKLSDVKSTDGKTTLLHFVVEEVVRAEGKRCVLNRKNTFNRSSSNISLEDSTSKEEQEREYTKLGLPIVGGLSTEFTNVKKAASIDYEGFIKTCEILTTRLAETQKIVMKCATNGKSGDGFVTETNSFIESAEKELKEVKEEQNRVMDLLKTTTEYYQAGYGKEKEAHPLQIFIIVKDFLGMVDQVCVDIAKTMQKKKRTYTANAGGSSSLPKPPAAVKPPVSFPFLPENFMSSSSNSSGSTSEDDDA